MNKMGKILVPIVTPFNDDESVNYDALQQLVKKCIDDGADGIYTVGSSAECYLLTESEKKKSLEAVMEAAEGAFVVASVGAVGTKLSVDLAKHAEQVGANMIASVPPFYFKYTFEEVKSYYTDLASCVDIPLMVYNIPSLTNRNFSLNELEQLLSIPNVNSIKYTDTDYFKMELLKNRTGAFIYSGRDECFLSAIAAGADGGIGTTFNVIVKKYIEIQKLYKQGDMVGALKVQHEANEIAAILGQCGIFAATKYLLEKKGIHAGIARKPFAVLTDEKRGLLDSIADKI